MSGENIHVRMGPHRSSRVQGPCPFCHARGGKIDCDFTGESNARGQPLLAHTEPTCEQFNRMTADEFVQAVLDGQHRS